LRCKNKTGCKKAECHLAARLTWPREQTHIYRVVLGGVSLEALRRRLSAVLPLSAGIHRKEGNGRITRYVVAWPPAFGGPTSVTLNAR